MNPKQKRIRNWLLILGVIYFLIWSIPNARGADSERILLATSQDEPVTYPHVVRMLTPAKDFKDLFSRWVLYGDYHYGYPFYFFSALVLLPVKLFTGNNFVNYTGLNLLLLRQFISVLPMLIAIFLLVYEQANFRSSWQTF